jgi:hypothetical protein
MNKEEAKEAVILAAVAYAEAIDGRNVLRCKDALFAAVKKYKATAPQDDWKIS